MQQVFGLQGALTRTLEGYRVRPQQIELAQAIESTIGERSSLIAEAGTGTGKTYAYLVPALAAGGRVIISTGTRNLQDQLFNRDLPAIRKALNVPVTVALLKGRANYLCHYQLELLGQEGLFPDQEQVAMFHQLEEFSRQSVTGDLSEVPGLSERSPVWSRVTSTRENCLGQDCPHVDKCFVLAARRQAQEAEVLVVNHHLFFADLVLRDLGAGELLPKADAIILDEAHQLPDIASRFLGASLSTTQIIDLGRDMEQEAKNVALETHEVEEQGRGLERCARDLRLALMVREGRFPAKQIPGREAFLEACGLLGQELDAALLLLASQMERNESFKSLHERCAQLLSTLRLWLSPSTAQISWIECFTQSVQLHVTPLSIAEAFKEVVSASPKAWIFLSATLAVKNDFSHFQHQLGLEQARTLFCESPFNYPEQALLYVPQGIPEPNTREYTAGVMEKAWPVVEAAGGRTFLLFTSHRALQEGAEWVRSRLVKSGLNLTLLVQGEANRSFLLEQFRQSGNGLLLGTQSFWEGVDVKGDALSLVVIDKLPFAPPDDPVLSARIEHLNQLGRNAFMEFQLPQAVITLKQGAGRLIRDEEDRGVLMICDPRLLGKTYGSRIWRSLPPMARTREESVALEFFRKHGPSDQGESPPEPPGPLPATAAV